MENTAQNDRGLPEHGDRICWDGHVAYRDSYLYYLPPGDFARENFTYAIVYGDQTYGVRPDEKDWWLQRPYVTRGWADIIEWINQRFPIQLKVSEGHEPGDNCPACAADLQAIIDGAQAMQQPTHKHKQEDMNPKFQPPELPPITNIRRYRYRPGDKIVVRINMRLSQDEAQHVKGVVANTLVLPSLDDVLVIDAGGDIKVLRNTSQGDSGGPRET